MFVPVDGRYNSASTIIDEKGNYEITVTAVDVKICVDNRGLKRTASDTGFPGVPIPEPTQKIGGPPKGVVGPPKDFGKSMQDKGLPKSEPKQVRGTYVPI